MSHDGFISLYGRIVEIDALADAVSNRTLGEILRFAKALSSEVVGSICVGAPDHNSVRHPVSRRYMRAAVSPPLAAKLLRSLLSTSLSSKLLE